LTMKALPLIIYLLFLSQIISPIVTTQQIVNPHTKLIPLSPSISTSAMSSSSEAPVGIVTFVSPTIETTQWLGVITIDSLSATSTLQNYTNSVSFQLNVMLNYQYNGITYTLWVQNAAIFDTQNNEIIILNNIWNESALHANITGVQGNGEICEYKNVALYAYTDNASTKVLSLPATISLLVNVSTNSLGQPMIYFWYNYGEGWVNYDTVTVTNVEDTSNVYFLVTMGHTANGLGYVAGLVVGGPCNGASAQINNGTVLFQLFYWNGHNFQEPVNVVNEGGDTAEAVSNANTQLYVNQSNGELYAKLVTGQPPSYQQLWNTGNTVQLTVNSPVSNGILYIYSYSLEYPQALQTAYKVQFVGGQATVTLYSGEYAIVIYQNGNPVAEANINGSAGQSISINSTQFSVSLSENQVSLNTNQNGSVSITVNAYGDVTISIASPPSVKTAITQETIYVNGQSTIDLSLYAVQSGTYNISISATIFPGFSITRHFTVVVKSLIYDVTFKYNVVGQKLSQEPQVTLVFPNGTEVNITVLNDETLRLPEGTAYTLQQTVTQGNTRWTTPTLVSGFIDTNNSIVNATYYEQCLVNFEYNVTNGKWNSTPPTVVFYNFTSKANVSLPAQVWVNANSTYCYQNVTAEGERIITTNYKGSVTSPGIITADYVLQYYVTVSSPIPVYAVVNGKNISFTSNWFNADTIISVENITYYQASNEREVVISITPTLNLTVNSPITVNITTVKQYYVTLASQIPVYAVINGVNETLTSGWYNSGTAIDIENITIYSANNMRSFILGVEPSTNITVGSPMTVEVKAEVQYYIAVNSQIPVYAVINGVNETLKSGWYNANTTIYIENITYYPSQGVRYLIADIQPTQKVTVTSPITVNITAVKQYYVAINSQIPVYALINGKNESLTSDWYNADAIIQIENLSYYPTQGVRFVIVLVSPSQTINLTSPITVNVSAIKQYYIKVDSPIPLKAVINGIETYLNSSWINEGTEIHVINYTYYNNGERYIITGISPQNFTVNSSAAINVTAIKQFSATINDQQEWINQGERITLTANVPIYETAEFVGTYNVSPGTSITVSSPITETLVVHPNYGFIGSIAGVILVTVSGLVVLTRRKYIFFSISF